VVIQSAVKFIGHSLNGTEQFPKPDMVRDAIHSSCTGSFSRYNGYADAGASEETDLPN
jgi:hypothetical protein